MKTKMIKFRMTFDTDKESRWLNRMAEQGWAMTGFVFGFYRFAKCEPGEYIYQVDVAEGFFSMSEDYRQFMEEMGVEIVSLWGPWVILRRKAESGAFEMYTDVESTITHYTKIRNVFQVGGVLEFACVFGGIYTGVVQKKSAYGWGLVIAAALLMLLFLREILRLNGILAELNSRLGKKSSESGGPFSVFLSGMRMGGASIGLLCAVFLYPMLYAVLHELGHCIAVWICGGTVTGFYPFSPNAHMTFEGVTGSSRHSLSSSLALIDIAGSVLPLAVMAAALLVYKGSRKRPLLNTYLGITSGISILQLEPWVVGPICYLLGLTDLNDDIFKFIVDSGFHPAAVTLCAIIICVLMCLLFAKKIPALFGGTVGKRFIISIAALMITLAGVIQVAGLLSAAGTVLAEGNIQYTVEGGRDPMLQEEFTIEIEKPGNYVCYVEFEIDREEAIGAVVLQDEEEVYFCSTGAVYLKVESMPCYLDSGKYTLSFYLLSSEEDWLEYCRITGMDVSFLQDFSWQPGASSAVTGSYRIMRK